MVEVKVLLLPDDMIVYLSEPKTARELLQLKNTFNQVAEYKINLKKKSQ